jgi:hypothetical protein
VVEVVAINLTRRLAHLSNDRTVPITSLIDAVGEETDEIAEAVVLVCGEPGFWLTVAISAFQRETVH